MQKSRSLNLITEYSMEAEKTWTTKIRVDEHYFADRKFADLLPENVKNTSHFLITDSNVDELYAEQVLSTLAAAGFKVLKIVIPPNEISKSMVRYVEILDRILASGLDKHSRILSLGGGVVNNIAGFLASTIYRGLHLIHIATTTLSQVDAAIDFKQAINAKYGKNLVGSFYPADFVIVDPTVCLTLTDRDFYNGLSESLKHALAQDKELFNYLIENASRARNADVLTHITKKTIEAKLEVMNQADPLLVEEMIKQYGHAIGHAIEHLSRGKLLHGEAIAIGMTLSARIGEYLHISPLSSLKSIVRFSRSISFRVGYQITSRATQSSMSLNTINIL